MESFEPGVKFARAVGIISAPEANQFIAIAIEEAEKCKEEGVSRTIVFNLCGHGNFDISAFDAYFNGQLEENKLSTNEIESSLSNLDTPTI